MLAAFSVGRSTCQDSCLIHCRNVSCRWSNIAQECDVSKVRLLEADVNTFYKGIQREPRPLEQQHHISVVTFLRKVLSVIYKKPRRTGIISSWMKHA